MIFIVTKGSCWKLNPPTDKITLHARLKFKHIPFKKNFFIRVDFNFMNVIFLLNRFGYNFLFRWCLFLGYFFLPWALLFFLNNCFNNRWGLLDMSAFHWSYFCCGWHVSRFTPFILISQIIIVVFMISLYSLYTLFLFFITLLNTCISCFQTFRFFNIYFYEFLFVSYYNFVSKLRGS